MKLFILSLRWAVLLVIIGLFTYWLIFGDAPTSCAEWGCRDDIY